MAAHRPAKGTNRYCLAKRSSIEQEITYAQANGNAKRIEGLKTALAKMNANCTDAILRSDAQRKVTEAQKKLVEREQDLLQAKSNGKKEITENVVDTDLELSSRQRAVARLFYGATKESCPSTIIGAASRLKIMAARMDCLYRLINTIQKTKIN